MRADAYWHILYNITESQIISSLSNSVIDF